MIPRSAALALAFLASAVCGCQRAQGDEDAIRARIQRHLSENATLNLAALDFKVQQVAVNGDRARAQVEFRLKQGGAAMEVTYDLARVSGAWAVLKSQPAGGQIEHPAMNDVHAGVKNSPAQKSVPSINDFFQAPRLTGSQSLPPGQPAVAKRGQASPPVDQQTSLKKP